MNCSLKMKVIIIMIVIMIILINLNIVLCHLEKSLNDLNDLNRVQVRRPQQQFKLPKEKEKEKKIGEIFRNGFVEELEKQMRNYPRDLFRRKIDPSVLHYDDLPKRWADDGIRHNSTDEQGKLRIFYIVGVEKCGTTDIFYELLKLPDCIAQAGQEKYVNENAGPKESRFWERHIDDGLSSERFTDWIKSNFGNFLSVAKDKKKFSIESTPRNFHGGNDPRQQFVYSLPQLIYTYQPHSKILIMYREPIARTWSDYHYFYILHHNSLKQKLLENPNATTNNSDNNTIINNLNSNRNSGGFIDFSQQSKNLTVTNGKNCQFVQKFNSVQYEISSDHFHLAVLQSLKQFYHCVRNATYIGHANPELFCALPHRIPICNDGRPLLSAYSIWSEEWLRAWPREQLFFGFLEEYTVDKSGFYHQLSKFFDFIPNFTEKAAIEVKNSANIGHYVYQSIEDTEMRPHTFKFLKEFFIPYNLRLASMLNRNLPSKWITSS